jgi:hypothetical protein
MVKGWLASTPYRYGSETVSRVDFTTIEKPTKSRLDRQGITIIPGKKSPAT